MAGYLIDTNVISNYFSGVFSQKAMFFLSEVVDKTPNLSVITKIADYSGQSVPVIPEQSVPVYPDWFVWQKYKKTEYKQNSDFLYSKK